MSEQFDFETLVDRRMQGSLRDSMTDPRLLEKGLPSFMAAEMDFPTAPCILDALRKRIDCGIFGFALCDKPYQDAVIRWMKMMRNWEIERDWIVPALGTIFSLSIAIRAFTAPGARVLIQRPVYDRYDQAIIRNERVPLDNPLILREDGHYEMDFDDLESKMALPDVTLMVLCNPQNPTGTVWKRDDLERLAELAVKHNVVVFSDEIYAEFCFLDEPVVPFAAIDAAKEIAISCTGLGKAFNFTGVNHANNLIPGAALREAFTTQRNRDHYGSIDPIAYTSVLAAYNSDGEWNRAVNQLVLKNGDLIRAFFRQYLPSVRVAPQEGAFTIWIDWRGLGLSDEQLFQLLEDKALIQTNHGSEYGNEGRGFCRMNIATPTVEIEKALQRLLEAAREAGLTSGK